MHSEEAFLSFFVAVALTGIKQVSSTQGSNRRASEL